MRLDIWAIRRGNYFTTVSTRTIYRACSAPEPYVGGGEGDAIVEVEWRSQGELRREPLAFRAADRLMLLQRSETPWALVDLSAS